MRHAAVTKDMQELQEDHSRQDLEASVTGDLDMLHLKLRLKADKDAEEQAKLEVPPLHAMLAFPMQQKRSRVAG